MGVDARELLRNLICYYNMVNKPDKTEHNCETLDDVDDFIKFYTITSSSLPSGFIAEYTTDQRNHIGKIKVNNSTTFNTKPYVIRAAMLLYLNNQVGDCMFMKTMKDYYSINKIKIDENSDKDILYDYYVMSHIKNDKYIDELKLLWEYMTNITGKLDTGEYEPLQEYIKLM